MGQNVADDYFGSAVCRLRVRPRGDSSGHEQGADPSRHERRLHGRARHDNPRQPGRVCLAGLPRKRGVGAVATVTMAGRHVRGNRCILCHQTLSAHA